jgi:hypothetical protein
MAYNVNVNSRPAYVGNDWLEIRLTFLVNLAGSSESYWQDTKGIVINDYGVLEWRYDIEERLLVPSTLQMKITDSERYIRDTFIFAEGQVAGATDQRKIQCGVFINSVCRFIGYALEDAIEFDEASRVWTITFAPVMDVLNRKMVYDINNSPLNPHGWSQNVFGFLPYIVERIFQDVNPLIDWNTGTLKFFHNWTFKGQNENSPYDWRDFTIEDLYILTNPLFYDTSFGLRTTGDVLKALAEDFGAFAGVSSYGEAFFSELFVYDPSSYQSLDQVFSHRVMRRYGLMDYVRIVTKIPSNPKPTYEFGTFTEMKGRFINKSALAYFWHGVNNQGYSGSGSTVVAQYNGNNYWIWGCENSFCLNSSNDHGYALGKHWYSARSDVNKTRVDYFKVEGINYNVRKNFIYDYEKFQPMSLRIHLSKGFSEFEALYLGT